MNPLNRLVFMTAKGYPTTNGFRFMVMLTRDRGFGFVGMKPEVAFGLIRTKMQACSGDTPGPAGTRTGRHADKRQAHGLGASPSSRSPSCDKACCWLNPPPGLRQRTRRHPKKPQRRASPVGRKLKNYPTLPQMECQPADFVQSRCNGLRTCFSRPCWGFFHRWREGRDAAQLSPYSQLSRTSARGITWIFSVRRYDVFPG